MSSHRRLLAARTRTVHLRDNTLAWLDTGDITAYRTGTLVVTANLADRPHPFHPGPGTWRCETPPNHRRLPASWPLPRP
jgi:alpha-glucosidase